MKHFPRLAILFIACTLLVASIAPVLAQPVAPRITVAPTWSPSQQLTTLDIGGNHPTWNPGDDYRYVDARINVTTSVEFWAVEFTCNVNANVLEAYEWDLNGTTEDYGAHQPPIMISEIWQHDEGWTGYFAPPVVAGAQLRYSATISKLGRSQSIGRNSINTTFNLMTLRFRTKQSNVAGTSPLACTFSFLDRDGKTVLNPTYQAPAPLSVIPGYSITGSVTYQGRTPKNNIGVDCWMHGSGSIPGSPTLTNAAGAFTFTNIRQHGHVQCLAYGNISNPSAGRDPDIYLAAQSNFNLDERGSYRFLPIELKAGNLDFNPCPWGAQCIDWDDLAVVTGSWGTALGDVNGDRKTDKADLAIVAGNFNKSEDVDASHVLYSVARSWAAIGRESRIWRGDRDSGAVVQQIPSAANTADFWAALSPDGSTIAFIRKTKVGTQPARYELFTVPATGGAPKLLLSKAAANNQDAFAPSWSWDSNHIAFVCSSGYGQEGEPFSGYGNNAGNLCMVDANGRNFRQLTGYEKGGVGPENSVKIFPPVWDGMEWLIFGGTSRASWFNCPETLCIYNIRYNHLHELDSDIPRPPNGRSDMPVSVNGRLFYRYTHPSESVYGSTLRFLEIDYEPVDGQHDYVKPWTDYAGRECPSPSNSRPDFAHSTVVYDKDPGPGCAYEPLDFGTAMSTPYIVDYYALSPYGFEIMLVGGRGVYYNNVGYRWDLGLEGGGACGPNRCWPEWWPNGETLDPDYFQLDLHRIGSQLDDDWFWPGNPDMLTLLHAERATVHWNP